MPLYQNILVAVDLTQESQQVLQKASALADGATISVIHVSEPLTQLYGGEIGVDLAGLQTELLTQAKELLAKLLDSMKVPADRQHIAVGKPATEIRRQAEELKADLIVIGTHSRHGFGILLGSTANGVLHGTGCDVLAVRINTDA